MTYLKANSRHFGMISASGTHNHICAILVHFKVFTAILGIPAPLKHRELIEGLLFQISVGIPGRTDTRTLTIPMSPPNFVGRDKMQFDIHLVIFASGHLAPEIEPYSKLNGESYLTLFPLTFDLWKVSCL